MISKMKTQAYIFHQTGEILEGLKYYKRFRSIYKNTFKYFLWVTADK